MLIAVALVLMPGQLVADEIRVAVASNFVSAISAIVKKFEENSNHKVILSFGSTGKHYAQIINGAPFDAFFAADVQRPQLLEKDGIAVPGSRFTYALGKVVLWSPIKKYVDAKGEVLEQGSYHHLAIANPKLAPYGKAAMEILQASGLWDRLGSRLVRGENISQTLQFITSGNAELGFVADSQVRRPDRDIEGSYWLVPQTLYTPIEQQAVLLKESKAARAFLSFVRSAEAVKLIHDYHYDTPL